MSPPGGFTNRGIVAGSTTLGGALFRMITVRSWPGYARCDRAQSGRSSLAKNAASNVPDQSGLQTLNSHKLENLSKIKEIENVVDLERITKMGKKWHCFN